MTKTNRTPLQTTEKVSRKIGGMKQTLLYTKQETFLLTGEPSDLQRVMADVHVFIGQHPLIVGGKTKKRVHVISHGTKPIKIFEGIC